MALPKSFDKYAPVLDARLKASIDGRRLFLYDMLRYHMGWVDDRGATITGSSGKGLRPMMCLWACEAVGGNWEDALPAAVALELVHNFSLIHDDIQDGDEERRHRPTVWSIWGNAQGINAGDSMRGLATLTLVNGGHCYPKKKLMAALAGLEQACLEMIEGQYLDISYEERTETTTDQYLDMISRKTGALIECSFYLGALIGTDSQKPSSLSSNVGGSWGWSFRYGTMFSACGVRKRLPASQLRPIFGERRCVFPWSTHCTSPRARTKRWCRVCSRPENPARRRLTRCWECWASSVLRNTASRWPLSNEKGHCPVSIQWRSPLSPGVSWRSLPLFSSSESTRNEI